MRLSDDHCGVEALGEQPSRFTKLFSVSASVITTCGAAKASLWPSGDQAGDPAFCRTRERPVPSALIRWIPPSGASNPANRTKAICPRSAGQQLTVNDTLVVPPEPTTTSRGFSAEATQFGATPSSRTAWVPTARSGTTIVPSDGSG